MIHKHPDNELLLEYAAGTLSLAPCISVTTHLQFCKDCTHSVESLNDLGGDLLQVAEETDVSEELFERILSDIDSKPPTESKPERGTNNDVTSLPKYVQQLIPAEGLQWRKLSAGLKVAPVSVGEDRYELALHRIEAGGKAPQHDHNGREITVVLKGSFSDEDGVYHPGDFIVREPGETHVPFASQHDECICLSVLEAPIRLTGLKRVLNPFLKFSPC